METIGEEERIFELIQDLLEEIINSEPRTGSIVRADLWWESSEKIIKLRRIRISPTKHDMLFSIFKLIVLRKLKEK